MSDAPEFRPIIRLSEAAEEDLRRTRRVYFALGASFASGMIALAALASKAFGS